MIGQNPQQQKELVQLITEYVTAQIGETENGKNYLKALANPKPQTAIAKFGEVHAKLKKKITSHETDSEKVDKKEEDVMYALDAMLTAYRGSKKEIVAIEIMKSMNQQAPAPKGPST